MTLLGRIYLIIAISLFVFGFLWALLTLPINSGTVEFMWLVPQLDPIDPFVRKSKDIALSSLLAGWILAFSVLGYLAIRAPFRIRLTARRLRRLRELEREVLDLRTLPLRQREEDDILAAEAHLEVRMRKVMTEQIAHDAASSAIAWSPANKEKAGERL